MSTCRECENDDPRIEHRREVAAHGGEEGEIVCLWPCGHAVYGPADDHACPQAAP